MDSVKQVFKIGYGPSSTHTMGPGLAALRFAEGNQTAFGFRVSLFGSLALTGRGHDTEGALRRSLTGKSVEIVWKPEEELGYHPNGMILEARDANGATLSSWTVFSVGGGDLEDSQGRRIGGRDLYPHHKLADILQWCEEEDKELWQYVDTFDDSDVWDYLSEAWLAMRASINRGLHSDGLLPGPLGLQRKAGSVYSQAVSERCGRRERDLAFAFALAVSEENAAGGQVVTAPTCGSAGVLPAALSVVQRVDRCLKLQLLHGLAIAGLVGNIVKSNASISGAEVGCQGEIGSACAMGAAAVTHLIGGTRAQVEYAAEIGFEHFLGLTCDPVEGYVQIPCIERNALAADHARACAVYARHFTGAHKVSFDRVVETVLETGRDMRSEYRETSLGGLARTWRLGCGD